jgi:mRNA interferase YafQ
MPSQKKAGKRAVVAPRACDYTKAFLKDWTSLVHSGRYDMRRLKEVMLLLVGNDEPLGPEWFDHALTGEWADHRECHVGGDFLLIYTLRKTGVYELIVFTRVGTHSQLFT